MDAGFAYQTNPPAAIVEAAHQSGAVCILAHPGRDDGFVRYDEALLDELREEAPIDGIEAYYPLHSDEQTQLYLDYTQKHNLFVSSGSDSHHPDKPPIKYRAELSRKLLERLGIAFSG
jgi:3',5'-nucleoside bisphosphate phosphatase